MPDEAAIGISAPDRKICGKIRSGTPTATTLGSWVMPMKKTPSAPPARARTGARAKTRSRSPGVHRDLHHDDHRDDPDEREEGRDPRADQLPEQDRVARDRGHEELGGEVVLALLDEVGDAGDGALVHRVGDHPDEHVREVGVRQRAAQVLADAAAQDPDEQDREDHGERDRQRALDRAQDLAPGDREDRVHLAAEGRATRAGDRRHPARDLGLGARSGRRGAHATASAGSRRSST